MAETRIEIRPEEWTDQHAAEVRAAFAGKAKYDTSGGLMDPVEGVRGGVFCRVFRDGEPVLWYVLVALTHDHTTEAEIALAHGPRGDIDLVAEVLPLIEQQCRHFDAVTVTTRRKGLIKKLQAAGYGMDAVTLRKRNKVNHAQVEQ